jgi:hypothetical protein
VGLLKNELNQLTYGGSTLDSEAFLDLFKTTWGGSIVQPVSIPTMTAVAQHLDNDGSFVIENYFDAGVPAHVSEAQSRLDGSVSKIAMTLTSGTGSEVYRRIDGQLYRESYEGSLGVAYASHGETWPASTPTPKKALWFVPAAAFINTVGGPSPSVLTDDGPPISWIRFLDRPRSTNRLKTPSSMH